MYYLCLEHIVGCPEYTIIEKMTPYSGQIAARKANQCGRLGWVSFCLIGCIIPPLPTVCNFVALGNGVTRELVSAGG